MTHGSQTETVTDSTEVPVGRRLLVMTARGTSRAALVFALLAATATHWKSDQMYWISFQTPLMSGSAYVDHSAWLVALADADGPEFSITVDVSDLRSLKMVSLFDRVNEERIDPKFSSSLLGQVFVAGIGCWVKFSPRRVAGLILTHAWMISIVLIASWFLDGRRLVRWLRNRPQA